MNEDKEFNESVKKLKRSMKALYLCLDESVANDVNERINLVMNRYQKIIDKKDKEIERLRKNNETYKKALEFYANEMSYSIDDYRGISGEMITRCILYSDCEERNDVYSYAGLRARQALSEVENE